MTDMHFITVESTQIYRGQVSPDMAAFLTNDGEGYDRLFERKTTGEGVELDFVDETKRTYECSCGQKFRKGETAREHLEEY